MRNQFVVTLVLFCGSLLAAGAATAAEEFKPMPAAEAEQWLGEQRDYLTDILWVGIDGYWHVGDWPSCLGLCTDIIDIDPQFVEAYTNAAYLLWNNDRDEEAIAMYQRGLAANPDASELYFDFGFFYRDRKQYDAAIKQFRLAVERGATRAQHHLLANTLEEAGRKKEALAEWGAILQRYPDDQIAKRKLARLTHELSPPVARQ